VSVHSAGTLNWDGLSTWYQVVGNTTTGRLPVVICHGGPGATHDEVAAIAALAGDERACVLYDQVGNGRSTLRPDAAPDFWSIDLFERELQLLVEELGWRDGYHLIGHSWGGILGMEHALTRPAGLRSLVLCDSPSSLESFGRSKPMFDDLPASSPQEKMAEFFARHICRVQPPPEGVLTTAAYRKANPEVFAAMNGPNPFETTGTLRGWDLLDRLSEIAVPTLLVSGIHDIVTPDQIEPMRDALPDARWELFENSSHMPFVEEPERFQEVVNGFLREVERR
jgi:L-proline amide hydrolase